MQIEWHKNDTRIPIKLEKTNDYSKSNCKIKKKYYDKV
jgi:hypothetical protein